MGATQSTGMTCVDRDRMGTLNFKQGSSKVTHINRGWVLASLLGFAGIAGCETHPEQADKPPATTTTGKIKEEAVLVKKKAAELTNKAAAATGKGLEKVGQAVEKGGEKLESDVKASAEKHLGESAGKAVEATGKVVEKAGGAVEKGGANLKDAVKKAESK
jgi:hypothetical protein